jgi:hypothetical protein
MLDPLAPATYYWRIRAAANDATVTSPTFTLKVVLPAPALVSPANGTQVEYHTQPVKLLVDNGVAMGGVLLGDTFEVATDAGFATLVVSTSLPQSASGQTALLLDPLPPAATYYWRVRAAAGDATVMSPTFTFHIAVALPTPVLISPASGVLIGNLDQPVTLIIKNPAPSAPVSGVTDTFEVARDAAFANIVVSRTVPQAANSPTSVMLDPLSPNANYYWRVRATASGAIDAVSATASFNIGPAIVSGPYRLTIKGGAGNPFTFDGNLAGTPFTFDGNLTVSTQALAFRLQASGEHPWYPNDLTLQLTLVADRVSGSLVSNGSELAIPIAATVIVEGGISKSADGSYSHATPVDAAGSVNVDGTIAGAFTGFMYGRGAFGDGGGWYRGTFIWSLAPR